MTTSEGEPDRRRLALILLGPVAVVVAVVAATVAAFAGNDAAPGPAPLELSSVSADVAAHYHAASDLEDVYRQVPCFCGCEEFLAHRHLADCFVRSDGRGWEAHAAGCGICIAESLLVRELDAAGTAAADIRATVVDRFDATPITAPPT